jgi:putative peptide zinc metalloprotease protein
MGVGLYIIWPVFYTDVTDAYRLGRWGRLRTDLGGIHFNAVFALVTGAVYAATGFEALLLIVLIQNDRRRPARRDPRRRRRRGTARITGH